MNKKSAYFIFIILAVSFYFLGLFSVFFFKELPVLIKNLRKPTQVSVVKNESSLKSETLNLSDNFEFFNITGQVKSVQDKKITITAKTFDSVSDLKMENRVIIVDENTKYYISQKKDEMAYKKELAEYSEKVEVLKENSPIPPPPSAYEKKPAAFSDVGSGNKITVFSKNNLRKQAEINAAEIVIEKYQAVNLEEAVIIK